MIFLDSLNLFTILYNYGWEKPALFAILHLGMFVELNEICKQHLIYLNNNLYCILYVCIEGFYMLSKVWDS